MAIDAQEDIPIHQDVYPFIDLSRLAGKLNGKVVLVTGASSGIGRSAALAFASCGAKVACVARRQDLLDSLVQEIKFKYSVDALAIPADLSSNVYETAKAAVEKATSSLGPIDILINNAGHHALSKFVDHDPFSTWSDIVTFGLTVPPAFCHAVLPSMIDRKQGGVLLNVNSTVGARDKGPSMTAYAVAKAGMIRFFQNLPAELQGTGIACYSVHPGNIWTDMVKGSFKKLEQEFGDAVAQGIRDRMTWQTVEQAANTIVTICADERFKVMDGRWINGEQDLELVLKAAESGRVEKEKLYCLKVDEL